MKQLKYFIGFEKEQEFIQCLKCRMRSFNLNDVLHKYCGYCHEFLDI